MLVEHVRGYAPLSTRLPFLDHLEVRDEFLFDLDFEERRTDGSFVGIERLIRKPDTFEDSVDTEARNNAQVAVGAAMKNPNKSKSTVADRREGDGLLKFHRPRRSSRVG